MQIWYSNDWISLLLALVLAVWMEQQRMGAILYIILQSVLAL